MPAQSSEITHTLTENDVYGVPCSLHLRSTQMQSYVGGFCVEESSLQLPLRKLKKWVLKFCSKYLYFYCFFFWIHDTITVKLPVIDIYGVSLNSKLQDSGVDLSSMSLPSLPIRGWETASSDVREIAPKIPCVTSVMHKYIGSRNTILHLKLHF